MTQFRHSKLLGLTLLLSSSMITACGDSNNTDPAPADTQSTDGAADTSGSDTGEQGQSGTTTSSGTTDSGTSNTTTGNTTGDTTTGGTTGGDTTGGNTDTQGSTDSTANVDDTGGDSTSGSNTNGQTDSGTETNTTGGSSDAGNTSTSNGSQNGTITDEEVIAFLESAEKLSGGDDDSPTQTESLSLVGPFLKDTNRADGPPSVPQGLTLLMSAENWLEFSWIPSVDDQSVEGYEILRDGTPIYTIVGDGAYEFDYRSWLTTSYIDCNYTRYTFCDDNPLNPGSSYEYRVVAIDNEGMRSAPSEPAVFQLAQRQSGGVDLTGYTQVLAEEFNGDSLDRTYWKTALPWGPDETINGERQYFVNLFGSNPPDANPFVFTGSTLQITGSETPANLRGTVTDLPYISGVLSTKDKFLMTYGYVEMSAKVAGGEGLLSTFYLFNQDFEKNQPEIDILEYIGSRPDKTYQTYHYYDSNRARWGTGERHSTPTMEANLGQNLSEGFHTYGVLWEPGLIVWYIDGQEVRRLTGVRVSDEPMNIIAQLVIGSEWIGEPNPASLPNSFEIDYIRAWQKQ